MGTNVSELPAISDLTHTVRKINRDERRSKGLPSDAQYLMTVRCVAPNGRNRVHRRWLSNDSQALVDDALGLAYKQLLDAIHRSPAEFLR